MRDHHERHQHHRRPNRRRGEARRRGYDTVPRAHGPRFRRRFAARDERIARLATHLSELRSEAQAVEEHIAALKAANNG